MKLGTHVPALSISALVHLALVAFALASSNLLRKPPESLERPLPLTLSMFKPQPSAPVLPPPQVRPPEPVAAVPPPPTPKPRPKPVVQPKATPKPTQSPRPAEPAPALELTSEPQVAVAPPVMQAAPAHPVPIAAAPVNPGRTSDAERAYKSALRSAIEANKHYPVQARRLRQEGLVEVGFTLRRDGEIRDLRVITGSGSDLLDEAALEAVRRVGGKLPFPDEIARNEFTFTLPLAYSLR